MENKDDSDINHSQSPRNNFDDSGQVIMEIGNLRKKWGRPDQAFAENG